MTAARPARRPDRAGLDPVGNGGYLAAVAGVGIRVVLLPRLPREPSRPRIAVWRKPERLGVEAVPVDARTREQVAGMPVARLSPEQA